MHASCREARCALAAAVALSTALLCAQAAAADCASDTGLAACVDADPLWLVPSAARFVAIAPASPDGPNRLSLGVGASYVSRPVVLTAASPDPGGREIAAVDDALSLTALVAYAPTQRLQLGVALPATLRQTGAGPESITAQAGQSLAPTALRDPRLGATYTLLPPAARAGFTYAVAARLAMSLPLGHEDRLAGERGLVMAPSALLQVRIGALFAGSQLGARLRQPTELGGARLGTQLVTSLGVGADLLDSGLLSVTAETWMLPSLVSQSYAMSGPPTRETATLVPAEWLASVRSALLDRELVIQLGAGTGLPLSSERRTGEATEHYAAMTTPELRAVGLLRYVPRLGSGAR